MKDLKNIIFGIVIAISLLGCHTARAIEPLFTDDYDDAFSESVELPQDSIGRTTAIDDTQWTKGADGHYRSDDDDCVFSKPLNKFQCEKE